MHETHIQAIENFLAGDPQQADPKWNISVAHAEQFRNEVLEEGLITDPAPVEDDPAEKRLSPAAQALEGKANAVISALRAQDPKAARAATDNLREVLADQFPDDGRYGA